MSVCLRQSCDTGHRECKTTREGISSLLILILIIIVSFRITPPDGTFMQYGDQTRDSHRYGGDVYDVGALLSAAQGAGEGAMEAVVGDGDEMHDLAALTANEGGGGGGEEGVHDLVGLTERGTWIPFTYMYALGTLLSPPSLHPHVIFLCCARMFVCLFFSSFLFSAARSRCFARGDAGCRKPEYV